MIKYLQPFSKLTHCKNDWFTKFIFRHAFNNRFTNGSDVVAVDAETLRLNALNFVHLAIRHVIDSPRLCSRVTIFRKFKVRGRWQTPITVDPPSSPLSMTRFYRRDPCLTVFSFFCRSELYRVLIVLGMPLVTMFVGRSSLLTWKWLQYRRINIRFWLRMRSKKFKKFHEIF